MLLGGDVRFRLRELGAETARVEPGEHLAAPDMVAFLHQHLGDALGVVERQLHLAQIHVAVNHELAAARRALEPPSERGGRGDDGQHDDGYTDGLGHLQRPVRSMRQ